MREDRWGPSTMSRKSRSVRARRIRVALYHMQQGLCFWCRCWVHFTSSSLDHIVPRVLGGSGNRRNLVMACRKCNSRRSARLSEEHLKHAHPDEVRSALAHNGSRLDATRRHLERQPNDPQQRRILTDWALLQLQNKGD